MANVLSKAGPNNLGAALTSPAAIDSANELHHAAGFAARLRDATKAVHREAERTGFIAALIRGRATRHGYALFLRNLAPVYAALEAALDTQQDTVVIAAFARPGLRRLPSLLGDLDAIGEFPAPADDLLLPEATAYAAAVTSAASRDATRLAAHAYARYLGDLSGGQILKPILARSLGLSPEMLRFYDFPMLPDPEQVKAQMRAALDTIPATSAAAEGVIAEAIEAFRHNIALSLAVERALAA